MLLAIVSWKRIVSWMTMPIWRRRLRSWTSRMSWPSIRIAPESTSQNRGSRFIRVVLPQPLGPTSAMRFAVADRQADSVAGRASRPA